MPRTVQEQERVDRLTHLAGEHRVAPPLNETQLYWLGELVPYLPTVPPLMHGGLLRWILVGQVPGSFLTALLSNDLLETIGRADDSNLEALPKWCRLLHFGAPPASFRSAWRVTAWAAHNGLAGSTVESDK